MNVYHNRFLSSNSAENVIGLFCRYPRAGKEITESWAMLEAAKKFVPNLNEYIVVVVGDGCSPRTGALMAYFTKAEVISVDPNFNVAHWNEYVEKQTAIGYPPQRLTFIPLKIEDFAIDCGQRPLLVLWPHSHADMNNTKFSNYTRRTDIAMPCCVKIPRNWMEKPHISYEDYNVLSPQRTVHIWK